MRMLAINIPCQKTLFPWIMLKSLLFSAFSAAYARAVQISGFVATTHAQVRRRLLTRMRSCYIMAGSLNEVIGRFSMSNAVVSAKSPHYFSRACPTDIVGTALEVLHFL